MARTAVRLGRSVMVAGPIASGKTSLARVLSHRLAARRVSFGAALRGMLLGTRDPTRRQLQDHGQHIIETEGASWLLLAALEHYGVPLDCEANVVFDGVRHKSMAAEIRAASRRSCLLFVDAGRRVRLSRYAARGRADIGMVTFNRMCSHRAEAELGMIRHMADFRIDNSEGGLDIACIMVERFLHRHTTAALNRMPAPPAARAAPACGGRIRARRGWPA